MRAAIRHVHRIPAQRFVTIAKRPSDRARTRGNVNLICPTAQVLFLKVGTTVTWTARPRRRCSDATPRASACRPKPEASNRRIYGQLLDPKRTCINSNEKVAAAQPLQRDCLYWQSCIDVQSPSFRKRSHFFNRLAWMRSRVYKSAWIITETDNQFINNVLHPAAVWPDNANQYNSVLDALFNEGLELR
jgi:hypothetical protein